MALILSNTLQDSFANIYILQANGIEVSGSVSPSGIDGRLEIGDWGGDIGKAMRVTLRDGDRATATVKPDSNRSEVLWPRQPDGEYWFKFEVFRSSADPLKEIFNGSITQILRKFDDASLAGLEGPMALIKYRTGLIEPQINKNMSDKSNPIFEHDWITDLPTDRWVPIVIHANLTTDGLLEYYIDGHAVWRGANMLLTFPEPSKWYPKLGLYNGHGVKKFEYVRLHYRNMELHNGTTRLKDMLLEPKTSKHSTLTLFPER